MTSQEIKIAIDSRNAAKLQAIEKYGFDAKIIFGTPLEGVLWFFGEETKTEFLVSYAELDYETAYKLWSKIYNPVQCWTENLLNKYGNSSASDVYDAECGIIW